MKTIVTFTLLAAALMPVPFAQAAATLTVLHSFSVEEGQGVNALVLGADGNYYGTAKGGGSGAVWNDGCGTVFQASNGTFTVLHTFTGPDGKSPGVSDGWYDGYDIRSGLVKGTDGNLYGGTHAGGVGFGSEGGCYRDSANGHGTLFRMTPDGTLTTLVFFNGTNGSHPSSLLQAKDGNFYGTTLGNGGTVFRMTPDGALTQLFSFDGTNGSSPSSLLQGKDGNFYGTSGGAPGNSSGFKGVFKMTPDGSVTPFLSFTDTNAFGPYTLMQASDGNFYGTMHSGGVRSTYNFYEGVYFGTIFKLTLSGTLTTLVKFTGANGAFPVAALLEGTDGNFYGSTLTGGLMGTLGTPLALDPGLGTLFKMTPQGNLTTLFRFTGLNGFHPIANLLQAGDGSFYGTTPYGGTHDPVGFGYGPGEIFRLTIPGADAPKIVSTDNSGSAVTLSWLALRGRSYQLQFTTDLAQTNWTNAGSPITATNSSATASDAFGPNRQRFYRVVLLP